MSTNESIKHKISNFMAIEILIDKYGREIAHIDFLDSRIRKLIKNITNSRPYRVKQGDFIDSISYAVYGNTSLWWLIAMYNGIIHPLENLEPGMILKIPSLNQINAIINSNSSNKNRVVVI